MKIPHLKDKLLTCAIAGVLILLLYFLDIPCIFKKFLHIPCPGCGMTRAYIRLMHLDIKGAFSYHPLFWTVPMGLLFYLYDGNVFKAKWLNNTLIILLTVAFIALWIYRMVTGTIP